VHTGLVGRWYRRQFGSGNTPLARSTHRPKSSVDKRSRQDAGEALVDWKLGKAGRMPAPEHHPCGPEGRTEIARPAWMPAVVRAWTPTGLRQRSWQDASVDLVYRTSRASWQDASAAVDPPAKKHPARA
jgi:hypothetical protein